MKKILLGSHSPRRIELLKDLNIPFRLVDIDYEEQCPDQLKGGQITLYLAKEKARHYDPLAADELLITADTIVWCRNQTTGQGMKLGKPHNDIEAINMLQRLSNNTHEVYTSVCFTYLEGGKRKMETITDKATVTFKTLDQTTIDFYINHFSPLDKAGAYGIQDWIGKIGIRKINGSFYNVMGFPIDQVFDKLKKFNIISL